MTSTIRFEQYICLYKWFGVFNRVNGFIYSEIIFVFIPFSKVWRRKMLAESLNHLDAFEIESLANHSPNRGEFVELNKCQIILTFSHKHSVTYINHNPSSVNLCYFAVKEKSYLFKVRTLQYLNLCFSVALIFDFLFQNGAHWPNATFEQKIDVSRNPSQPIGCLCSWYTATSIWSSTIQSKLAFDGIFRKIRIIH